MQILEEIRTYIPFAPQADSFTDEELQGSTQISRTDNALQKVFEDRMEIFSLINESLHDVVNPKPTFLKSLEPYLSLDYNHDDLIAINSIVDGEINTDIPSIQDVDGLLALHTKNIIKQQHVLFQRYNVDADEYFRKQNIAFLSDDQEVQCRDEEGDSGSEEGEGEGSRDPRDMSSSGSSKGKRGSTERQRNRTTAVVAAAGVQKMSVEEFHQKILWERWSGNGGSLYSHGDSTPQAAAAGGRTEGSSPPLSHPLLQAHSPAAGGLNVGMTFKPPAWHNRTTLHEKPSKPRPGLTRSMSNRGSMIGGGATQHEELSFDDFMRSIPMFHALSLTEFEFIEENSSVLSFEDQELIVSEGQRADTVFVVREGVVQRVKARANPTLVRRGDIFGDSAVTGQTSQATYLSAGSTLLICIPPKIFNAILHSSASASDLNVSNEGVVQEDSILSNHIEKFLDVLYLYDDTVGGAREEDGTGSGGRRGGTEGGGSNRASATAASRASAFNLSQQSHQASNLTSPPDSKQSDHASSNVLDKQASLRGAPRLSQVLASSSSNSPEQEERGQGGGGDDTDSTGGSGSGHQDHQQQQQDDNSSEPDSEPDSDGSSSVSDAVAEVPVPVQNTKLKKPMVEPISTRGSVKRRGSSVLSFSSADFSQLHKDGAGASSSSLKKSSATGGATSEMKTAMSASSSSGASMDFDAVNRKLLLELQASSSPELSFGDTVEHMVRLTREFFGVDRVGFFIVDKEKGILFLKVTQDGAGLKIPLKGIAGHIARTGQTVNIEDAYLDERFDPTMDLNTGYRTKQMLCVPVCDYPGNVAGVLQLINTESDISFQDGDVELAEIVATQIGDVMYSMRNRLSNIEYTPIYKVRTPFRIRLGHVLLNKKHNHIKCTVQVLHGGVQLGPQVSTGLVDAVPLGGTRGIRRCNFDKWLEFGDMTIGDLPQACRVIFQLSSKNNHPAGWCGMTLFTYEHHLKTGDVELNLWDDECPSPNVPALQNIESGKVLTLELPGFGLPIIYEIAEKNFAPPSSSHAGDSNSSSVLQFHLDKMPRAKRERFMRVLNDPIASMTAADKENVWKLRYALMNEPTYLPKFLLAVDWFNGEAVTEAYHLLYKWEIPHYVQALQMLDSHYPDPRVRAYAVQLLGTLSDDELLGFMLQLTQLLKFEPFHDSALARFLLRRALTNPEKLYMRTCGEYRTALGHQLLVMRRLEEVARRVQACATKEERLQVLRERVAQTDFPSSFQLPLNPNIKAKGIIAHKCRVMESKKKPLWLTFENAEPGGKNIVVMFKAGDDLRQDQLTLQVLSVMDKLWKKEDMDMKMSAYGCISTGDEIGMLEIVLNSATLANIVAASRGEVYNGSGRKIMAALDALYSNDVLQNWLMFNTVDSLQSQRKDPPLFDRAGNPRPRRNALSGPPSLPNRSGSGFTAPVSGLEQAKDNFLKSCAGYCVATFVMGIGDRHNDNIMMKRTGELFHIDFGHFLGNFKWKYGIKRERAPFVFTPAFAAVLGGEGSATYQRFVQLAVKAFNVLRKNSSLLVTLFSLMVSCGIPELQREEDIAYLSDNLMSGETDAVAAQRLTEIISQCLHTRTTQLNDAVHLLVHA